jgi:hypothetical protein
MGKIIWICLTLLIFIHTADMELTRYYIGNEPKNESFPPMSWAISKFGVDTSIWISRAIMYPYMFIAMLNYNKRLWKYSLVLVTILYWVAMIPWWFQLGILSWPFPKELLSY